ncbi:hypothetical protein TrVE_jg1477 [Triparma verrucosa]|uniref:Protein RER1 n=2 Tax=Triparma TaxID=722752 RepID=A0A9W7BQG6_9STRA|nr:hypothetical protein TrVE_jg1477 [Triparma verrucosa]GMH91867.1 hypothetical protein TrST_g2668 [Triparma strigata]
MDGPNIMNDSKLDVQIAKAKRLTQYLLDKSTIHLLPRWLAFLFMLLLFTLRIYLIQGFFIIAYGLGIYLLNNFIAFLTPLELPSSGLPSGLDTEDDGLTLPTSGSTEYRPFARRLPEFKFWLTSFKGVTLAFVLTFFTLFDVPVFWPILLLYFITLFFFTMKRQIMHMVKHRYVPVSWGKKKVRGAGVEKYGGGMKGSRRNE